MMKKVLQVFSALFAAFFISLQLPVPGASAREDTGLGRGEAYDYVVNELLAFSDSIDVERFALTEAEATELLQDIKFSVPELFFLSDLYDTGSYVGSDEVAVIYPHYTVTEEEYPSVAESYNAMFEELCAQVGEDWSDAEIITFCHDLLVTRYEYDLTYSVYDTYGMLEGGSGVCQAYSLLYIQLMNRFGIPCTYVSSTEIGHMWNAVCLDGAWYYVDVTWDDPTPDRAGRVSRDWMLIGSGTLMTQNGGKHAASDLIVGGDVAISAGDHPLHGFLAESGAQVVEVDTIIDDEVLPLWYAILTNSDGTVTLSEVDLNGRTAVSLRNLSSDLWLSMDERSYYLGNYSSLLTNGKELYYNDMLEVFAYDPKNGTVRSVYSFDDGARIYGMTLDEDGLTVYRAVTPLGEESATVISVNEPIYYTVTWILGDAEPYYTLAAEGSQPLFNGSTYRETKNGIEYTFFGWSPALETVTGDVTYTALYFERKLYKAGDVNGDNDVNISDVTSLLNYLSNPGSPVNLPALDVSGDGFTDIGDVTALLNFLAGVGEIY